MKTLLQRIESLARQQPETIAILSESTTLSYAELWADINDVATLLKEQDIQSLAIYLDNGIEWIVIDLACQLAAVSVVPLPWFFSPAQRRHACLDGAVQWVIASESLPADVPGCATARLFYRNSVIHELERSDDSGSGGPDQPVGVKISYTSGTTGQPRGIRLSPAMIEQTALSISELLAPLDIQNHLSVLPYSTLLENIAGIYVPLLLGKTIFAEPAARIGLTADLKLDAALFARSIAETSAASMIITPQLLEVLCLLAENGMLDTRQLRFIAVGGARVAIDLLQRARKLGIPAFEGYGLTEFASVALLNTPWQARAGSVGKPLPGVQLSIADDGEILLTRRIPDDWGGVSEIKVATGDLGQIDADGFVYVSGRKSNLIVLATGRNVSPEWIETELNNSPLIQQSLVYGEAQPQLSALIHAHSSVSNEQLDGALQRINQQLPAYAHITQWTRVHQAFNQADGTLTPNGRLRRRVILERLNDLNDTQISATVYSFTIQENASC